MVESFQDRPYAQNHFQRIVSIARKSNPFYRRWITDPKRVPIIDRTMFLDNNEEILNGHPVTGSTSGSTGIPVRFSQSPEWTQLATADMERFVRRMGGPLRGLMIIYAGGERGANLLDVAAPVDRQIQFITQSHRKLGSQAVTTYPTNAEFLAREILHRNLDMAFVRRFGMYGEAVERYQLDLVRKAFPNAQVWTSYSSMEFAIIASMCPYEPEFHHVRAHRLGVEVLTDDGSPAAIGERGRVVITDFFNERSPFIRYELGDFAVRGVCPCGRIRLPALGAIYGKVRGALLHRDGRRVLFTDLSVALRDLPGMRQYQVVQNSLESFTVNVVADRNLDPQITAALDSHFGYMPNEISIRYVDVIPREENGKFHASICRV